MAFALDVVVPTHYGNVTTCSRIDTMHAGSWKGTSSLALIGLVTTGY